HTILHLSIFLLYASASLHNLHSFPTRRSSDLRAVPMPMGYGNMRRRTTPNSLISSRISPLNWLGSGMSLVVRADHQRHSATQPIDRKSTRLNSSHVAISYAVFCLKKKNKHQYY